MQSGPQPLSITEFNDTKQFLLDLIKADKQLYFEQFVQALNEHQGFNQLLMSTEDLKTLIFLLYKQTVQVGQNFHAIELIRHEINALHNFNYLLTVLNYYIDYENTFPCSQAVLLKLGMLNNAYKAIIYCDKHDEMKEYEHDSKHPSSLNLKIAFMQHADEIYNLCAPFISDSLFTKKKRLSDVESTFKIHLPTFINFKVQLNYWFCTLSYQRHDSNFADNIAQFNAHNDLFANYYRNPQNNLQKQVERFNEFVAPLKSEIKKIELRFKQRNSALAQGINQMMVALNEYKLNFGFVGARSSSSPPHSTAKQIMRELEYLEKLAQEFSITKYFDLFQNHLFIVNDIYQSTKSDLSSVLAVSALIQAWYSALQKLKFNDFLSFSTLKKALLIIKNQLYIKIESSFSSYALFEYAIGNKATVDQYISPEILKQPRPEHENVLLANRVAQLSISSSEQDSKKSQRQPITKHSDKKQSVKMLNTSMQQLSLAPNNNYDLVEAYRNNPVEIFRDIIAQHSLSFIKHQAIAQCAQFIPTLDFRAFLDGISCLFINPNASINLYYCTHFGLMPHIALGLGKDFNPNTLGYNFIQSRLQHFTFCENTDHSVYILALLLVANLEKERMQAFTPIYEREQEIVFVDNVIFQFFKLYKGNIDIEMRNITFLNLQNILLNDIWPNFKDFCMRAYQQSYAPQQQNFTPLYNTNGNTQNQYANITNEANQIEEPRKALTKSRRRGY